jgi:hypothetical protein
MEQRSGFAHNEADFLEPEIDKERDRADAAKGGAVQRVVIHE